MTAGNAGDGRVAEDLIEDLIEASDTCNIDPQDPISHSQPSSVYGDAAYGTGEFQSRLEIAHIDSKCKAQPPTAKAGLFTKALFTIDLKAGTVTCPSDITVRIRNLKGGDGIAKFNPHCESCFLTEKCTTSKIGRKIRIGKNDATLARVRKEQADPIWKADYRAFRPKVERKFGHLMRRKHGGRRAKVRGPIKVDADFSLLAAEVNLARLAKLEVRSVPGGGWEMAT